MTTGVVTSVSPKRSGDTLAATTASTDTVLLVDDAGDFAEDFSVPRYLVIGDETTPREYVAVENDEETQQSVTLAAPVGSVLEAGLPITLWDPESEAEDKRAVEYRAWVRLDDSEQPIPASLPHATIPLAGAFTLTGAHVRIEETEPGSSDWYVAEVLGREPSLDPAKIATPIAVGRLSAAFSVPDSTERTITGWTISSSPGWGSLSDLFIVPKDGRYLVTIGTRWGANSTGQRACWFRTHSEAGIDEQYRDLRAAASFGGVSTQATGVVSLREGNGIEFRAYQTSGAALSILSGDAATGFSIVWIGDI